MPFSLHPADGFAWILFPDWTPVVCPVGLPLGRTWTSVQAEIESGRPAGDFLSTNVGAIAAQAPVARRLESLGSIELLPIPGVPSALVLNPTSIVDCVDRESSEILCIPGTTKILRADLVLQEELLDDLYLFRIPEKPSLIFTTDAFREEVESQGWTGIQLWGTVI